MPDDALQEAATIKTMLHDHGAAEALHKLQQDVTSFGKDPQHSQQQTSEYWTKIEKQLMTSSVLPALALEWGREEMTSLQKNSLSTIDLLHLTGGKSEDDLVSRRMAEKLISSEVELKADDNAGDPQSKEIWKKFMEDPSKLPDCKDAKMVEKLLNNVPDELKYNFNAFDQSRQLLFGGPHSAREFEDAAKHCDATAAFDRWLQNAANQPGASETTIKAAAGIKDGFESALYASEYHSVVASNPRGIVSDADSLSGKEKAEQAALGNQDLLKMIENKEFPIGDNVFADLLSRSLQDGTLSTKDFNNVLNTVTDTVLKCKPSLEEIQYAPSYRLLQVLGAVKGLPADRQELIDQKATALGTHLEQRINGYDDAKDKLFNQEYMIFLYKELGMDDSAKKIYKEALTTSADLPADKVEAEKKYLHEKFDQMFEAKSK